MKRAELYKAKDLAIEAAKLVEPTLLENFGRIAAETKSCPSDVVTEMDRWAERQIAEKLAGFSADVDIVGEEFGRTGDSESYWTIDPIDGTSGYVRGIDYCTTMISLVIDKVPVLGVINDFVRGEMFWAIQNEGAYMNDEKLAVSERTTDEAQLELYLTNNRTSELIESYLRNRGARLRGTGGTGKVLTMIASGKNEGFVSFGSRNPKIWDYAPGLILAQEAGAKVGSFNEFGEVEEGFEADNLQVVIANNQTYPDIADAVKESVEISRFEVISDLRDRR